MVLGSNKAKNESLLLNTKGGIRCVIGGNIDKNSLDLTLQNAFKLNINGADEEGNSYISNIVGNVNENIIGTKSVTIGGSYNLTVTGIINETVYGTKLETFVNDKHTNYGGDFTTSVLNNKEENIGLTNIVNISGDALNSSNVVNQLNITSVTSEESILICNKK